jgi:hypothetical protein
LITCDIARQWLHLRRTQELAKLKGEVAAELAASNMPAPPLVGVCSSPPSISPAPAQAPAPTAAPAPAHRQGLGFRNFNHVVVAAAPAPAPTPADRQGLGFRNFNNVAADVGLGFRDLNNVADVDADADDDCAELDSEGESSDVFEFREFDANPLNDRGRVVDLNSFGNDFSQAASNREEDSTILLDSEVSEFQINPPPSQHCRLSIDPHDMHAAHVQFWNSGIREDYANRHIFSQQSHTPSPHNSATLQSPWLQGARA